MLLGWLYEMSSAPLISRTSTTEVEARFGRHYNSTGVHHLMMGIYAYILYTWLDIMLLSNTQLSTTQLTCKDPIILSLCGMVGGVP